jgi:hypothetical protein
MSAMHGTRNRSAPSFAPRALPALSPFVAVLAACLPAIGALALPATAPASAQTVAPLPAADYTTRPACAAPAPGRAGCLALELVPKTAQARAHTHPLGMTRARATTLETTGARSGAYGLRPADLRAAYFPGEAPEAPPAAPQTIALVDAYNDPQAEADLRTYDKEFGIEECSEANGCFEQVGQQGKHTSLPFPKSEAEREAAVGTCEREGGRTKAGEEACTEAQEAEGWAVEIATDVDTASAICQRHCHIVLVEAESDEYQSLEAAEETAVRIGHEAEASPPCANEACDTEVSNSWGGPEPLLADSAAFDHPGTAIVAAAGDNGYLNWAEAAEAKATEQEYYAGADYPASSPHVVAVGGTRLALSGGSYGGESVWNDDHPEREEDYGAGGGGCSSQFAAPPWQRAVSDWSQVGCEGRRAVADVAADGDPYSGVAVYDSVPDFREEVVGGKPVLVNTPLGWWPIGGTSVAAPIIASMFALAGGSHGVEYPAKTLYEHLETGLLHPVTQGGNGECDALYSSCTGSLQPLSARFDFDCGRGALICNAGPGYNGPTGVGTPDGIGALQPLSEAERSALEAKRAEEAATKAEAEAKRRAAEEAEATSGKGGGEGGEGVEAPAAETHTATAGGAPGGGAAGSSVTEAGGGAATSASTPKPTGSRATKPTHHPRRKRRHRKRRHHTRRRRGRSRPA